MTRFTKTVGNFRREQERSTSSPAGRGHGTLRRLGRFAVLLAGCLLMGWYPPHLYGAGPEGPVNRSPGLEPAQAGEPPAVQVEGGARQHRVRRRMSREMVQKTKADMQMRTLQGPEKTGEKGAIISPPAGSSMSGETMTALRALAARSAASGKTPGFYDLPSEVREKYPISVSMVVYSLNAGGRSITVNGSRLREGEQVYPGMKLVKITPDGAVFDFMGCRFSRNMQKS